MDGCVRGAPEDRGAWRRGARRRAGGRPNRARRRGEGSRADRGGARSRRVPPRVRHEAVLRALWPGRLLSLGLRRLHIRGRPSPRAAAAQRLRAHDLQRHMTIVLGDNQYGKSETHVVRVTKKGRTHEIKDLNVSIALAGDFADTHLTGDNSKVVPTDTQKNTIFAFAH